MNRRKSFQTATVAIAVLVVCNVSSAGPGSDPEHELMVYSIRDYGNIDDALISGTNYVDWKPDIPLNAPEGGNPNADPANGLWSTLYTNCNGGDSCAYSDSNLRKDSDVTVDAMCSNDTDDDFNDADMVIFSGHNTHITGSYEHPLGEGGWSPLWPYDNRWTHVEIEDARNWGTSAEWYFYHWPTLIFNASITNPYVVIYGYNPITSILMGKDYVDGDWTTRNSRTSSDVTHNGRLGGDLEWFIANGCNGVPVARSDEDETFVVSNPRGVNAWKRVWSRIHLVMGHYHYAAMHLLPNLATFAADMRAGVPLKDAYFDLHVSPCRAGSQPSAISAVKQDECCFWQEFSQTWYCGQACVTKYMTQDTWNDALPDPTGTLYYVVSWNEGEGV